jgi:hypothetical protein
MGGTHKVNDKAWVYIILVTNYERKRRPWRPYIFHTRIGHSNFLRVPVTFEWAFKVLQLLKVKTFPVILCSRRTRKSQ